MSTNLQDVVVELSTNLQDVVVFEVYMCTCLQIYRMLSLTTLSLSLLHIHWYLLYIDWWLTTHIQGAHIAVEFTTHMDCTHLSHMDSTYFSHIYVSLSSYCLSLFYLSLSSYSLSPLSLLSLSSYCTHTLSVVYYTHIYRVPTLLLSLQPCHVSHIRTHTHSIYYTHIQFTTHTFVLHTHIQFTTHTFNLLHLLIGCPHLYCTHTFNLLHTHW